MIPQRDLSLLANRLAAGGGRRIPETVLERDYCLAWFLVGLSASPLRAALAFKGGTALKRCYFGDYRFSEDLDFTLRDVTIPSLEALRADLEVMFAEVRRRSGIAFRWAREDRHGHTNSYTFYLGYEGPLPPTSTGREVKVDVTLREHVVFPLEARAVVRGYPEYADVPEAAVVDTYALEEITTEKLVAVTDRARNEPRDLYDLWYLLGGGHVDLGGLRAAVDAKLAFRGRDAARLGDELAAKEARLRKLWSTRLAAQMATLPEFDEVFRAVRRFARNAGVGG